MIVAPVSMDLARYGQLRYGVALQTESLTAWSLAAGGEGQMPYWVITRGPDSSPAALYRSARRADAVYLVTYHPAAFELRPVGTVTPAGDASAGPLATFGQAARLLDAARSEAQGLAANEDGRQRAREILESLRPTWKQRLELARIG